MKGPEWEGMKETREEARMMISQVLTFQQHQGTEKGTHSDNRSTEEEEVAPGGEGNVLPGPALSALGVPSSPAVVVKPPVPT